MMDQNLSNWENQENYKYPYAQVTDRVTTARTEESFFGFNNAERILLVFFSKEYVWNFHNNNVNSIRKIVSMPHKNFGISLVQKPLSHGVFLFISRAKKD